MTPYLVVWAYTLVLLVGFVAYWIRRIERRHRAKMAAIDEALRSDAEEFARNRSRWIEYLRAQMRREQFLDEPDEETSEPVEDGSRSGSLVVRGVTNNDITVTVSLTAGEHTLTVPANPIATPHGWEAIVKGLPAKAVSELLMKAAT